MIRLNYYSVVAGQCNFNSHLQLRTILSALAVSFYSSIQILNIKCIESIYALPHTHTHARTRPRMNARGENSNEIMSGEYHAPLCVCSRRHCRCASEKCIAEPLTVRCPRVRSFSITLAHRYWFFTSHFD